MLYLGIRNGSLADWAPVDDTGSLVNITFFIQSGKYFQNRLGTALVHRETLAVPVSGGTQFVKLFYDTAAVLFFPLPCFLQEALTTQIMLVNALLFQLIDNLNLRCDRRMVGTRLPQCLIALHSLVTDQDILHGVIQRMSHMKLSGNIWRRHHNRERLLAVSASALCIGVEIFAVQPFLIQAIFNICRIICFFQFFH